jgi:hypothetical protein
MKKQDVISLFENSIGSMFAKEDVLRILNQLEEPKVESKPSYPSKEWLERIKVMVLERITEVNFNDSDLFDISDFQFDIKNGNQIEIDSYEVDACPLKVYVENEIETAFGEIEDDIIEIQETERLNSNEALKEAMED